MAAVAPPLRVRAAVLGEVTLATALSLWLALRFGRPSAWLAVPVLLVLLRGRRPGDFGLEPRFRPPSFRAHLVIGAVALGGYALLHVGLSLLSGAAAISPRLPPGLPMLAATQLLVIALPEEVYFRGYLQDRLERAFPPHRRWLGAPVGTALVLQAAIFAACHLARGDWSRLAVFFFGLLAGWLRARSGSIAAPVVYHAVGNLWVEVLDASLRRHNL